MTLATDASEILDSLFAIACLPYDTKAFSALDTLEVVVSIPRYDLDLQTELQLRGDQLDRRYTELWMQERALVADLGRSDDVAICDAINGRLDLIRYEMTVIQNQLDHDGDLPYGDDAD